MRRSDWRVVGAVVIAAAFVVLCWWVASARDADGQSSGAQRCIDARRDVEATGAVLPDNFEFRCGYDDTTGGHWGRTSGPPYSEPYYVAVNLTKIGSDDTKLRYVVVHEAAHARASVGLEDFDWRDEEAADRYAASKGWPNKYFARVDASGLPVILSLALAFVAVGLTVAVMILVLRRRRRNGHR